MTTCSHCGRGYSGPTVHMICDTCHANWCHSGNCLGSSGKRQSSRNPGANCQTCRKGKLKKP